MIKNVLITGGAGFIGSHLADELIAHGYKVRALDNLSQQVHCTSTSRPDYLHPNVDLRVGDVRDIEAVSEALDGIDAVFHFAAMVGVGQSMYRIEDYTDVNNIGTAVLLEALAEKPVQKLIVASSMSIYGEGLYKDASGHLINQCSRNLSQLKVKKWEMFDSNGNEYIPVPTPETKQPCLSSIYALSKYNQEQQCLIMGNAYGISTSALRFFNVYGTRQSLSNPYTGVLAIFASRLLNNNPPLIFEDGLQKRDFVHVTDVARACRHTMESTESDGEIFNIGSGNHYTILEIAEKLSKVMGKNISAELTSKYRKGDIRHCFADLSKAEEMLRYKPTVNFEDGLYELAQWLKGQIAVDSVDEAAEELAAKGLTI